MGTAIAKVMKQVSPREHQLFLGVPFYLFGYKRGCWVTAIDPRLQNLEFGYSYLAVTADCIHKCVIFQNPSEINDFRGVFLFFVYCGADFELSFLTHIFDEHRLNIVFFAESQYN